MATNPQTSVRTATDYHAGTIGNLDDAWTRRLIASVVDTESSGGNLRADNGVGYYGRYQGGAGWLTDAGLVNREKYDAALKASGFDNDWQWGKSGGAQRFLADASNWNNGLSLDKYLASADLQDQAFRTNSNASYRQAVRDGVLSADTPPNVVAGFLKARHLGGYDNAIDAAQGRGNVADANGTTTGKYYNDIARNNDGFDRYFVPNFQRTQTDLVINPMADGLLKHGERGDAVTRLQQALNDAGIRDARGQPLPTTGYYGDQTEAAVRQYQTQKGLQPVDGKAGHDTLTALGIYDELRRGTPAPQTPQSSSQTPGPQPQQPQQPAPQPPQTAPNGVNWPAPGNHKINEADKPGEGRGEFNTPRGDHKHGGIDIQGKEGDRIEPFRPGKVVAVHHWNGDPKTDRAGNYVVIDHGNGVTSTYMHLKTIDVKQGQDVGVDTQIGTMGRTGNTPRAGDTHLHFEIKKDGVRVDPLPILNGSQKYDAPRATASPDSGSLKDTLLVKGEDGAGVKRLQEALNAAGVRVNGQPLPTTGHFGDQTEAAVKQYQTQHNLQPVDGKAGRDTLTALGIYPGQQQTNPQQPAPPAPQQTPNPQQPAPAQQTPAPQPQAPQQPAPQQSAPQQTPNPQPQTSTQPPPAQQQTPPQTPTPQVPPSSSSEKPPTEQSQPQRSAQTERPSIADPKHPDHRLYEQAMANLQQLGPSGGFKSQDELTKAAAAVAADARASGLNSIDHVAKTNTPNGQTLLVAVEGNPTNPASKNAYIDYTQATTQTVDQSSRMAEATRTQQQATPAPNPQQAAEQDQQPKAVAQR